MTEIPEHLLKRAQAAREKAAAEAGAATGDSHTRTPNHGYETHVSPLTSLSAARQQKLEAQLPLQKNQVVQ